MDHKPGPEDILEMAERRKWWLVAGALAGLLLGYAAHALWPATWTARAVILYEPRDAPKSFFRDAVTISFHERLQTLEERLKSDGHIEQLLQELGKGESFDGALPPTPGGRAGLLRRNLEVALVNGRSRAQVFELRFSSPDPDLSAHVVQSAVALLREDSRHDRRRQADATTELLDEEIERLREKVDQAEEALATATREGRRGVPSQDRRDQLLLDLDAAERRLANLRIRFTDLHPEVKKTLQEVRWLRAQIAKLPEDGPNPVIAERERHLDDLTAQYQKLVERSMEATLSSRFDEEGGGDLLEVLRPARAPGAPSWPDPFLLLPGGAAAGLGLAILLVAAVELRTPVFGSVRGLGESVGMRVVASIPQVDLRRMRDLKTTADVDPRILVYTAPESTVTEQYRGVLPVLLEREGPTVILVTSATRGDGKSVTAANLAASVAQDLRRSALLLDADLRRPTQHRLFHRNRSPGLRDVLRQDCTLEEATRDTAVPRLALLSAGLPFENPVSLLSDDAFLKVIDRARGAHQVVFIDAPPLVPVIDARILSRLADLVFFVVRAGTTPRSSVLRSIEELGGAAGVIFNEVSASSYRRHYYGDAYARYAYGDPPDTER